MNFRLRLLFNVLLAGVLLAASAGCGAGGLRDAREDRDPLIKRAREKKNAQDIEGAVAAYNHALDRRPTLARAHLELGWIYDQDLHDYVRAIYHYERYLEMRPDSEKSELVKSLSDAARISFATTLPEKPNEAIRMIASLQNENAALRARLEAATPRPNQTPVSTQAPAAPVREPAQTAVTPAPVPAAPPVASTYVVQSGDTLSRIAAKVYGDSKKWPAIYNANRAALPSGPQGIKVGQTLQIPKQ